MTQLAIHHIGQTHYWMHKATHVDIYGLFSWKGVNKQVFIVEHYKIIV